jgi:hypothetical protein
MSTNHILENRTSLGGSPGLHLAAKPKWGKRVFNYISPSALV